MASRTYKSQTREESAQRTRERVLRAASRLFSKYGIDGVTLAQIAESAKVGHSTVFALFQSKVGLLRALMERAVFNAMSQDALKLLETTNDPLELLKLTAKVARSIWEGETRDFGLLRGASSLSPELKKVEVEFDNLRYDMQRKRIEALFDHGLLRVGLDVERARDLLWMYTSRDIYRMLIVECSWSNDAYEEWLEHTLLHTLIRPEILIA